MVSTIRRVEVLKAWALSAMNTKPGSQPGFSFKRPISVKYFSDFYISYYLGTP
jgi:hypothetical protein